MKNIDLRAILWGCVADIGGTTLFSFAFGLVATVRATLKGIDPESFNQALIGWSGTIHGMLFSLFFGLFFTGFGGYVAARFAKSGALLNSALVGSVGIIFSLFFIHSTPIMITIAALVLSIPIAIIGGFCHTNSWKW
jgi:hypothetical protein